MGAKRMPGSTCKDPENRSKKNCCCGGHSTYARKKRKRFTRDSIKGIVYDNEKEEDDHSSTS
jgi:hypothetical protein